jgi:hypothetical protein
MRYVYEANKDLRGMPLLSLVTVCRGQPCGPAETDLKLALPPCYYSQHSLLAC